MKSSDYYAELDKMAQDGVDMKWSAAKLNKSHPQIPVLYCNKIVTDWIKDRNYGASKTSKTH